MGFSEKTHVFIIAKYYEHLTRAFGERGREAFIHATKYYARQRGSRMAQRVIRDGEKLDYASFCRYGEWVPSQESIEEGTACAPEVTSVAPDYEFHVHVCPWQRQFAAMGMQEAGKAYCTYLDEAIMHGYHAEIDFRTIQTQHTSDYCVFKVMNAGLTPDTKVDKVQEYVKGFDYHCAHTYYSFAEMAQAIFGAEGTAAAERVLGEFRETYGETMTEQLTAYQDENFNVCR